MASGAKMTLVLFTSFEFTSALQNLSSNIGEKINGSHIEKYAKLLKKDEPEIYEQVFSGYLKNKVDPSKISSYFDNTLKTIKNNA